MIELTDFLQRDFGIVALRLVFETRETLCLDRIADNHLGLAVSLMAAGECPVQICQIMAVASYSFPAE